MRPKHQEQSGSGDLFRSRLDQIINMRHELVLLACEIDWDWLEREVSGLYADKGYVGHDAPKPLRVFRSGQKRGVHGQIRRELRRRSAIEPVIEHMKEDGHLGRNFLKGRHGDQANAVLSAVGYNFRLILKWLRALWLWMVMVLIGPNNAVPA